jgi:hypothetical protein
VQKYYKAAYSPDLISLNRLAPAVTHKLASFLFLQLKLMVNAISVVRDTPYCRYCRWKRYYQLYRLKTLDLSMNDTQLTFASSFPRFFLPRTVYGHNPAKQNYGNLWLDLKVWADIQFKPSNPAINCFNQVRLKGLYRWLWKRQLIAVGRCLLIITAC